MATHADDALRFSATPTAGERPALGGFEYSTNRVVLHTDARVMPRRRARGRRGTSTRRTAGGHADALTMTYHMNRLQSLPGPIEYCVSVNPATELARTGSSSSAR